MSSWLMIDDACAFLSYHMQHGYLPVANYRLVVCVVGVGTLALQKVDSPRVGPVHAFAAQSQSEEATGALPLAKRISSIVPISLFELGKIPNVNISPCISVKPGSARGYTFSPTGFT